MVYVGLSRYTNENRYAFANLVGLCVALPAISLIDFTRQF